MPPVSMLTDSKQPNYPKLPRQLSQRRARRHRRRSP